jgi:hypothetical protein
MPSRSWSGFVLALIAAPCGALLDASAASTAVSPDASAAGAAIAPFSAHYTADWKSINVGTSDLVLTPDAAAGDYLYTWTMTARGVFRIVYANDVVQKSWLSVSADHVRPEKYRAEDGTSTVSIDFDWQSGHARGDSEKKPVNLKLSEGVQDVMSSQVEVMLDLKNGNLPKTFRIVDRNEIKDFIYTQEGTARIRTALGELDTVIVSSRRAGGDRILRMWFAPSLGYVPVLAERSRAGKLEFTLKIKTLK